MSFKPYSSGENEPGRGSGVRVYVRVKATEKMSKIKTARERERVNEKKVRKSVGLIKDCIPWGVFSSNSFSKIHERACFIVSNVE